MFNEPMVEAYQGGLDLAHSEEQVTEALSGRIHGVDPFDDPSLSPRVAMMVRNTSRES